MTKSPEAFRTISEVAELLETPAHVLRFWESRFPQIRPVKRAGGRRYYRPADVALLTGIRHLLHDEGMTIRGVQKILREQGVRHVSGVSDDTSDDADDAALEAALAASGGVSDDATPLPPAEAETAQIIALQTALRQTEYVAPGRFSADVSAPDNDLFGRIDRVDSASMVDARLDETVSDAPSVPAETLTDPTSDLLETVDQNQQVVEGSSSEAELEPEPDGAPMEVWAEPLLDPTPAPVAPNLIITRISTPQPTLPDAVAPTIALRLRATKATNLSAADRATLLVLRAKARSLRDRLGSQSRSGA